MIKNILINAFVSLVISIAVVAIGLRYYYTHYEQKLVAVNFDSFLKNQEKLFLLGKITQKQFEQNLERGVAVVKKQPKNALVLDGMDVLRGHVINIK